MADSPASVISGILRVAGVSNVETGRINESPNAVVGVYDQGGVSPNPVWLRDEPTFSILVRGDIFDYTGAYNKALDIKNILLGLPNQVIGDSIYTLFYMRSDITFLNYDTKDRPQFTMNWRMVVDHNTPVGNRKVIA